jgi:carbamoyl-phosphate synthase large subunit
MESLKDLLGKGYQIAATPGTAKYYSDHGLKPITLLAKPTGDPQQEKEMGDTVLKWISNRKIDLVINIPEGTTRRDEVTAGYLMRRAATDFGISLLTNIK